MLNISLLRVSIASVELASVTNVVNIVFSDTICLLSCHITSIQGSVHVNVVALCVVAVLQLHFRKADYF